jgi:3'-phosphoadenosine 5'-phosphosulfate sulfotransferase (PAPS reductase)/FAD synthetase
MKPFVDGPSVVSFSGGRTSGYMLWRILKEYGGSLPEHTHVVFANTGVEREETLEFVRDCGEKFGVKINWVEYRSGVEKYVEVDFSSASRNGEPFTELVRKRQYLPNPVSRFCTQELKIRCMKRFMCARGYVKKGQGNGVRGGSPYWTNYVGIRADEPRRLHRSSAVNDLHDVVHPLAYWGVTHRDVREFWQQQSFDLRLRSYEGNCTLCFLKGADKVMRVMRDRPDLAQWWIDREAEGLSSKPSGGRFRNDRPRYSRLLQIAQQPALEGFLDENHGAIIDCYCSEDSSEEGESCGVVS